MKRLVLETGDGCTTHRFSLERFPANIGRRQGCDIVLEHESVSSLHASIVAAGGRYFIFDRSSANGVRVGNHRIEPFSLNTLLDGTKITLGEVEARIILEDCRTTSGTKTCFGGLLAFPDIFDESSSGPVLLFMKGPDAGKTMELGGIDDFSLGRSASCSAAVEDRSISGRHFGIRKAEKKGFFLSDCGSRNGTCLNGKRICRSALLKDGDIVAAGRISFMFLTPGTLKAPFATIDDVTDVSYGFRQSLLFALGAGCLACSLAFTVSSLLE